MWKDENIQLGDWSLAYMLDENKVGEGQLRTEDGVLVACLDFQRANVNRLSRNILLPRPRWINFKLNAGDVDVSFLRLRIQLESPEAPFNFAAEPVRSMNGWTEFQVDVQRPSSLVNVWRFYGQRRLSRISLVIEKPGNESAFELRLTGLEFRYGDERVENYKPERIELKPEYPPNLVVCLNQGGEYYRVPEVLRQLFPQAQLSVYAYRGQHLPLDGWPPDLSRVSLVVMVDVDSYVLPDKDLALLADYVHSGGAFLVFAGPNSVNGSIDGRPLAKELLPAEPGTSVKERSESSIVVANRFLAENTGQTVVADAFSSLGYPGPIQSVVPRPTSDVVACDANGRPVAVVGEFGAGKTALVTCSPDASIDKGRSLYWSSGYASLIAALIKRISLLDPIRAEADHVVTASFQVRFPYSKRVFSPCGPISFEVVGLAEGAQVRACLRDWRNRVVWEKKGGTSFSGTLPDLADGVYHLVVACGDEEVTEKVAIAPPIDKESFYPIIARVPVQQAGHWFGPKTLRWMVDDVAAHGVNTVAVPVGDAIANDPYGFAADSAAFIELCAQEKGMGVMYDYTHLPTFSRQSPAPFDVRAVEATEKALELAKPWTEFADLVPRLFAMKTIDEPTADHANLNLDADHGEEYRQKVGFDVPDSQKESSLSGVSRLRHWLFVSDYARKQFRLLYEAYHRQGKRWGLLHTFMEPGFGSEPPTKRFEDVFAWGGTADYLDFDIYPYWYPESHKRRFAKVHYGFAFQRCVAQYYGKPMGFYVELDDRNWPYQQNPKEATGELAYTAVGEGCHYLNTFIYGIVGAGTMARPERWEDGGTDLAAIAKAGPLLLETERVRAKVGLYFPYSQWIMDGPYYPTFGLELFRRKFGECDIIHEQVALCRGFDPYDAIILLNTDVIPAEIERQLIDFVERGGLLIMDHCPSQTPEGQPLTGLRGLVNAPENLDRVYRCAVENDDYDTVCRLETWAHDILKRHGLVPAVRCSDDEFEAGLLAGKDVCTLVVVNHRGESAQCDVQVFKRDVGYVCDVSTGKAFDFRRLGDSVVIPVRLSERQGVILGLYPCKPEKPKLYVQVEKGSFIFRLSESTGCPLPVFVDVIEPSGRKSIRHSRQIVLRGEARISSPLAVNHASGKWTVRIVVPALGYESSKEIDV